MCPLSSFCLSQCIQCQYRCVFSYFFPERSSHITLLNPEWSKWLTTPWPLPHTYASHFNTSVNLVGLDLVPYCCLNFTLHRTYCVRGRKQFWLLNARFVTLCRFNYEHEIHIKHVASFFHSELAHRRWGALGPGGSGNGTLLAQASSMNALLSFACIWTPLAIFYSFAPFPPAFSLMLPSLSLSQQRTQCDATPFTCSVSSRRSVAVCRLHAKCLRFYEIFITIFSLRVFGVFWRMVTRCKGDTHTHSYTHTHPEENGTV